MFGIALYHAAAMLAFTPYFFSWTGVVVAALGYYLFAMLGINLGYHRLLAHRSLSCPKWLEHLLALFGVLCLQLGPAYWVAIHRRHHQSPDDPQDPHSPRSGFYWAHVGWILTHDPNTDPSFVTNRYAKDLMKDKFYAWLESGGWCFLVPVASWGVYFAAGFAVELFAGGTIAESVRSGSSILVWGVFVRTVIVWHITWSVNSVCHLWGYRNYETPDRSRNNPFVGVLAHGEGWHNNHHAEPRSARHGHRWWELDTTWMAIKGLAWMGLATDVQNSLEVVKSVARRPERPLEDDAGQD
ncbi:MAG: fatty acid desaturase [Reyranella sp.]|nr:fatty acid desaturase [Reyranella sp.]